eukprot:3954142-Pyramimonas_sp.AAC.1
MDQSGRQARRRTAPDASSAPGDATNNGRCLMYVHHRSFDWRRHRCSPCIGEGGTPADGGVDDDAGCVV